jgi:hypothetical protein
MRQSSLSAFRKCANDGRRAVYMTSDPNRSKEPAVFRPGDIYEDCAHHPCLCVEVDEAQDDIWGISLIDGSQPRSCSLRHCGIRKLNVAEAWAIKMEHARQHTQSNASEALSHPDSGMTKEDEELVALCLREICIEDYIPEWEFATVVGASRSEVEKVRARWPAAFNPGTDLDVIVNIIVNLMGYPHDMSSELEEKLGYRISDLRCLIESLNACRGSRD